MKKIYEQPSVECTRIVAEVVMNNTDIIQGGMGVERDSACIQE